MLERKERKGVQINAYAYRRFENIIIFFFLILFLTFKTPPAHADVKYQATNVDPSVRSQSNSLW